MEVWRSYGVRGWPSFVLIDPLGRIAATGSGEGERDALDAAVTDLLSEGRRGGTLAPAPLRLEAETMRDRGPLLYPGGIAGDGTLLYVADTGHNRVLVAGLDGKVHGVIGTGEPGWEDGPLAEARFHKPHGLAADADGIYVADTENHVVRKILPHGRVVRVVAGTGVQARDLPGAGHALHTPLSSPWGLALGPDGLYVAMAGDHRIWRYDPRVLKVEPFAGTGREGLQDGPRAAAWLAQPSGVAVDGDRLYVADSEVSAVRRIGLGKDGRVETLVGRGLFEFGDADGAGDAVRLQHPLGVACLDGRVYVADTYNHKVKVLDPATRECRTLAGGFYEPGAICAAAGALWVADTNHHRIVRVDPRSGRAEPVLGGA